MKLSRTYPFFDGRGQIIFFCVVLSSYFAVPKESLARRTYVSPEQQHQLSRIHTVLITTTLILPEGVETPAVIQQVVSDRLRGVGLEVVLDATQSYDAEIRVTCEEEKRETATTRYGGDAELANTPDRLWRGAACLLGYRLGGIDLGWYQEVRAGGQSLVQESEDSQQREHLIQQLADELRRFDFPVFLLSEWGQTQPLLALLRSPQTSLPRKQRILEEFRYLPAPEGQSLFLQLIDHPDLSEFSIGALAGLGAPAIPVLQELFEDPTRLASVRAAAAKALGQVGLSTGELQALEPLLKYLTVLLKNLQVSADIEFDVLGEVVWAIGQVHHDATFRLIDDLQAKLWVIYDTSPEMDALREKVSVVHKYVDLRARIL